LLGDIAIGLDSNQIDLLFVGDDIDEDFLYRLVRKAEAFISRKVFFQVCTLNQLDKKLSANEKKFLLIWQR